MVREDSRQEIEAMLASISGLMSSPNTRVDGLRVVISVSAPNTDGTMEGRTLSAMVGWNAMTPEEAQALPGGEYATTQAVGEGGTLDEALIDPATRAQLDQIFKQSPLGKDSVGG